MAAAKSKKTVKPAIVTKHGILLSPASDAASGAGTPTQSNEIHSAVLPSAKLKIAPLSPSSSDKTDADVGAPVSSPAAADKPDKTSEPAESVSSTAAEPETEASLEAKPILDVSPPTAGGVADSATDSEADNVKAKERAANIEKLIENRTYYLPINQIEKRRNRRYVVLGVICIVLLGLAWADVALDSGILTIPGIKSPTHFFK